MFVITDFQKKYHIHNVPACLWSPNKISHAENCWYICQHNPYWL